MKGCTSNSHAVRWYSRELKEAKKQIKQLEKLLYEEIKYRDVISKSTSGYFYLKYGSNWLNKVIRLYEKCEDKCA